MSSIEPTTSSAGRRLIASLAAGQVNWVGGSVKAMLLDSTYTFVHTHQYVSDVVAHEVSSSGTGYGRQLLSGNDVTYDDLPPSGAVTNFAWVSDGCEWTPITLADFRWLVIFQDSGSDATSPLIAFFDYGTQSITTDTLTAAGGTYLNGSME